MNFLKDLRNGMDSLNNNMHRLASTGVTSSDDEEVRTHKSVKIMYSSLDKFCNIFIIKPSFHETIKDIIRQLDRVNELFFVKSFMDGSDVPLYLAKRKELVEELHKTIKKMKEGCDVLITANL